MGRTGVVMSDDKKEEIAMAECGSCRSIVPLNSENCPECDISFSGVSDEALGECGACNGLVALDSTKCSHCGTIFVADDVVDVLRKWLEETGISIPILFKKFDKDGDGQIDSSELKSGLLSLNLADLPPSQVERLIKTIDEDGDGRIDLRELHETITGEKYSSGDAVVEKAPAKVKEVDDSEEVSEEGIQDESSDEDDSDEVSENDDSTDESDDGEAEEDSEAADENEGLEIDDVIDDIEEDEEDEEDEDFTPVSILNLISDAMDESGDSPSKYFNYLDKDGDGNVSVEEFTDAIEELIGDEVSTKDIESFIVNTDDDGDGAIDIIEFVNVLESLEDSDEVVDEDTLLSKKVQKIFPTDLQRKMMGKKWNDVVWPLIHFAFGLFIAAWLINGMGGIGPLGVDGTGGNVVLETAYDVGYENWMEGDIYPCEPSIQVGECKNSLTPLSGDASSMPAGFYWDGVLLMVLGGIGIIASLATHLAVVPGWRARAKAMKEVEDDTDEARTNDSDEDIDDEDEEESEEDNDDGDYEDDSDEESVEDMDDESEDAGDDGIDVGSHIGLTLEDEEIFGVIIEFDDEEETVTIKEDSTGDLVTGYQEDMFVE